MCDDMTYQSAVTVTIRFLGFWQDETFFFDCFFQPLFEIFDDIRQQLAVVYSFLWNSSEIFAIVT